MLCRPYADAGDYTTFTPRRHAESALHAVDPKICFLCNYDDPRQSEFFKYFAENFEKLKLKRLINVDKTSQKDVCPVCGQHFEYEEMEGDHIVPWSKGGKTVPENLQMLCRRDNALKSDR